MHDTLPRLEAIPFPAIRRARLTTLQVNLGYRCNQSCLHCHVNAGPNRTEEMAPATIDLVLQVLEQAAHRDPRHHRRRAGASSRVPPSRRRGARSRRQGDGPLQPHHPVRARPGGHWPRSSPRTQVEVVASMPCYLADNVDRQRGNGVFDRSIRGLRTLNALGYGDPRPRARAEPRLQSAGAEPAARPEGARGRLQAGARRRATASSSTSSSSSPTCRSSASARR